jgi:hypothetical protein
MKVSTPSTATMTTAPSHATVGLKKLPASWVIVGSVRLMVPVSPRTWSWAPNQVRRPASVTTNDGILNLVKKNPWKVPIAVPARMPAPIAGAVGHPCLTLSTAMTAEPRP